MEEERKPLENRNFIDAFIEEDLAPGGRFEGKRVHTRFPPEPNGYLHIGHCKALTIDFGTAEKFGGLCNLRMDDTNPTKEDTEYVDAIQADIHWLGFDWDENLLGTTALAISTTDDVVAPAKILADFAKTHENFNLKAGYLEGKVIGEDEVKKLAAMPSKEVLIAQVLYSFNFPIMQLAIACDAIVKKAEGNEEMKVAELVAPKEAAAEEAAE